jgi:hypothetical protein
MFDITTAPHMQPGRSSVKSDRISCGFVLLAAVNHPSKATRAALVADTIARLTGIPRADAAAAAGAGASYTNLLANLSGTERYKVAREQLSLAQIFEGAVIAAHYDDSVMYVLDTITAPTTAPVIATE